MYRQQVKFTRAMIMGYLFILQAHRSKGKTMQKHSGLVTLTLFSAFILAACGGDSSDSAVVVVPPPPPPGGPTDAERASAASTTAATNVMCSTTKLGTYYWEIGDASGAKVSATQGSGGPTATTVMKIFSSSKWLYAANVVQKRGVQTADVPFLNFTSGYSKYGNAPICNILRPDSDTVQGCVPLGGEDAQDPATIGRFDYDSGHMQHHAAQVMGLARPTMRHLRRTSMPRSALSASATTCLSWPRASPPAPRGTPCSCARSSAAG
jgi:hypothetical protein